MTKTSSSKKQKSEKRFSKLSAMRRKLTLRRRSTPPVPQEETAVVEEAELPTVRTKKLFQRASPMRLVRLYPHMSEDQRTMIRNANYGGLLDIKCSKLQPELCKFLMQSFDPTTCSLVFPGRGTIPVTERSVRKVIGVPRGNVDVCYEMNSEAIAFMSEELGNNGSKQPTLTSVEKMLIEMKQADAKYLRLFITYSMSSLLAPTTGIRLSPRVYRSVVNIEDAKKLNVCKFIVTMLCKAAKCRTEKAIQTSCMLYLMIKYIDSLQLRELYVNPQGTRVSVWTNSMVKQAIMQDMGSDGHFGVAPLKPEFSSINLNTEDKQEDSVNPRDTSNQGKTSPIELPSYSAPNQHEQAQVNHSILFPEPEKISKFIEMFTPLDRTEDETTRYRDVIEEACRGFEASLQMIVSKLSVRQVKSKRSKKRKTKHSTSKTFNGDVDEKLSHVVQKTEQEKTEQENAEQSNDSDEDFRISGEEIGNTQTPVSLDGETFDSRMSGQESPEETFDNDERYIRRKKRSQNSDVECNEQLHGSAPDSSNPNYNDDALPIERDCKVLSEVASQIKEIPTEASPAPPQTMHTEAPVSLTEGVNIQNSDVKANDKISNVQSDGVPSSLTEEQVTTRDSNKENVLPDSNCIDIKKTIPQLTEFGMTNSNLLATPERNRLSCQTSSRSSSKMEDDDCHEEVSFGIMKGENKKQFLEFVRSSPPRKWEIPRLEPPVLFDLEYEGKPAGFDNDILKGLKEMDLDETGYALPSIVDGTAKPAMDLNALMDEIDPPNLRSKRKSVTFADQKQKRRKQPTPTSPSPSKYRTRSAAREELAATPTKVDSKRASPANTKNTGTTMSPRMSTRQQRSPSDSTFHGVTRGSRLSVVDTANKNLVTPKNSVSDEQQSGPKATTPTVPSSAGQDSMNRRLIFDSSESDRARERAKLVPDAPPFDLDTPPEENQDNVPVNAESSGPSKKTNTPVEHAYHKRVIRAGKQQKSPYLDYENKTIFNVPKGVTELYNMVCTHHYNAKSRARKEMVLDYGTVFASLGDLADSVVPREPLVNHVCEAAVHIIASENSNPKKVIMPLRIAGYLIDLRFQLKDVKRVFEFNVENRLDQKDLICFPTLQKLTSNPDEKSGHYWLVNLNIKARRFEIIDSLGTPTQPLMMHSCHVLIASIKTMWAREWPQSKVKVADYPIEIIPSPRQGNSYDCGYFTLTNLEGWHGRRVPIFEQKDMPNIRKLLTDKWLRWHENVAEWKVII